MSRINELIAEFCPAGVPFKAVADVTTKNSNIRWAGAGDEQFQYVDLTSVDRVTRRIGETVTISSSDAPSRAQQIVQRGDVIFATTRPAQMRWAVIPVELDGQIVSTGYCVLRPDNSQVLTSFLAHVLSTDAFGQYIEINQVAGNYPSIPDSRVRAFRVPIPPLEVQREIVRILDQFTQLEVELEVELKAELEARRRQYAHYRDSLLTLGVDAHPTPMGELGQFIRGRRFTKNDVVDNGIPSIHYGEIYTHYGVSTSSTVSHVRADLADKLRYAQPRDVVIAAVGETVEDVAKAVAWLGDVPVAIHDDTFLFRSELNPKFVSYYLQTADFHLQKNKFVARAKVKRLSAESLAKIAIPVLSLGEQERIVAILDNFDALVNELSVGLPAELVARRKQFEYYRDRLFTFEEAAA